MEESRKTLKEGKCTPCGSKAGNIYCKRAWSVQYATYRMLVKTIHYS